MAFPALNTNALKSLFVRTGPTRIPTGSGPAILGRRDRIDIDFTDCLSCGACMRKCPTHSIVVDRSRGEWKIDRLSCLGCADCVEACPKNCLMLTKLFNAG
jgi:ech hydrogenase subunit F